MSKRKALYILPRLKDCKGDLTKKWYVEYSFRNSETDKLERFRIYEGINEQQTASARTKIGNKIVKDIQDRINKGWTPFHTSEVVYQNRVVYEIHSSIYGKKNTSEKNLLYYISQYLDGKESLVKKKTFQDYTSKLRILYQFFMVNHRGDIYAQDITNKDMIGFALYLIEERKLQRRTILDFIQQITTFFGWLEKQKVIGSNPVYNLPEGRQTQDCSAQPMMQEVASHLLEHIKKNDEQLYLFCAMIFYCAIRPGTELRLLKVKDVNLFTNTITISEENAKRTAGAVKIPPALVDILKEYRLHNYEREFYLFGKNKAPGIQCWGKNRFRLEFNKYRDELNLPKEYKLYSWKCTGAILFAMSGAPLPAIRDHLRHKHTQTTDVYLSKRLGTQNDYVKHKFPKL